MYIVLYAGDMTNKLLCALHEGVTLNIQLKLRVWRMAHCAPGIRNISTAVSTDVCMADTLPYIHIWYV